MFSVFADVRKQIRFKKEHPTVESAVFVSMKVSMVATLAGCILCTAKTYIGDNINCVTGFPAQEHKAIETYCFIASTFSMVNLSATVETPYPGLGGGEINEDTMTKHAYYQWVPMVLAIQVAVLYFPRWFWKNLDGNKFKDVLGNADSLQLKSRPPPSKAVERTTTNASTDGASEKKESKKRNSGPLMLSAQYLATPPRDHTRYALKFLLCELIAFVISLGNLFFTNAFLGGKFFWFGKNALSYLFGDVTDIDNPLNQVFPKIAKCTWHKFGATGSIQSFDSMCVLPLNIVNEKTFVFLWLVYITTTSLVAASLLWHITLALVKNLRDWQILRNIKSDRARRKYNDIKSAMDYGDWFMMKHLSGRMVPKNFEMWFGFYSKLIENQMKNKSPDWTDSETEE